MTSESSFQARLECIERLHPLGGVVHVGAGAGLGTARYPTARASTAILIEADADLHRRLASGVQAHPGWHARHALVAEAEGEKEFFLASNPNENGLLAPEMLSGIWRNLKTRQRSRVAATTLDALMREPGLVGQRINWLVVDCLPALPVLRGAPTLLQECDVVVARVALGNATPPEAGAAREVVDGHLATLGFRALAFEEERQPAIGRVLYIRDWKSELGQRLAKQHEEAARAQEENLRSASAALAAERDRLAERVKLAGEEAARLASECEARIRQAEHAADGRARLAAQAAEAQAQQAVQAAEERVQQATQAAQAQVEAHRQEATRHGTERERLAEQEKREREEQARLAVQAAEERAQQAVQAVEARVQQATQAAQAQVEAHRQEATRHGTERERLAEQEKREREEQARLAQAREAEIARLRAALHKEQARVAHLEARLADLDKRQRLMHEEMVKAEGQIDLIKDVLLREAGL